MKKVAILFTAALCTLVVSAANPLFSNGKTVWKIVVPQNITEQTQYAVDELTSALEKVSKIKFEVTTAAGKKNNIFVGSIENMPEIARMQKSLKLPAPGTHEALAVYLINDNLYLAGNNDRGVNYAVYSFLQNQLGVRWFWPGEEGEFIPELASYTIPAKLAYNFQPAFPIRAMSPCGWHRHIPTEQWLGRNFLNGDSRTVSFRNKGSFIRINGGHQIALSRKLFATKPEWFSMIGGKRRQSAYAGCWSNPEVFQYMVNKLCALIEKNKIDILNAFPADIIPRCECPECLAIAPTPSDRWYTYYAKLIEALKVKYPKLRYAGIAYQEFRAIPQGEVKHLEYVEYCHYNRCYAHDLDDAKCPINQRSMNEITKWSQKSRMGIYGYEFDLFPMYTPSWYANANAMRVYKKYNMYRIKTEISVNDPKKFSRDKHPQMIHRLTYWMWSRLVWDPDADVDALLADFCNTVYGKDAAKFLLPYHKEMGKAWQQLKIHPTYFHAKPLGYARKLFTPKRMKWAKEQFAKAIAAAKKSKNARYIKEVDTEHKQFLAWVDLYNAASGEAVITVPYIKQNGSFDKAISLPMTAKAVKSGKLPHPTESRIYWDEQGVHLQMICMEPDMKELRAFAKGDESDCFKDDNVELLVDPGDGKPIRQLCVSASGSKYDGIPGDASFNTTWDAKVKKLADRWIVEITLPFKSFGGKAPKDNKQWQLMVIRNSRPAAIGFPRPSHMDSASCGTIYLTRKAEPGKTLMWISSEKRAGGFDNYKEKFLQLGWDGRSATDASVKDEKFSIADRNMIIILTYQNKLSPEFYSKHLVPALNRGATVVFWSYAWLDALGKYVGDPSYKISFKENATKIRRLTKINPAFDNIPHKINKVMRSTASGNFYPAKPELWDVMAWQKARNKKRVKENGKYKWVNVGEEYDAPCFIARKFGKGKVVVIGDIYGAAAVFDNIYNFKPVR